jgi:glycosyltransferase involved in cell wall biosynthesis
MMLSVILPVYNECNRLNVCVDRLDMYLRSEFDHYEIIIIEDNSTDESYEIARRIAGANKYIVLMHNKRRLGRGASLVAAIKKARGDLVIYMDVDLATDIGHTRTLVDCLVDGASVTTGSRFMRDSQVKRPLSREIASRSYNSLVRLLFGSKICDHQCGFKGFRKRDVLKVIDRVQDNHWFWDTELLVLCQKLGMKVVEFPVKWAHNGGDNLNPSKVKVLKDSVTMGKKLLQLKYRLIHESRRAPSHARAPKLLQ